MPSSTQLAYFAALLGSGIFFLVLAFMLFLPVVILAPSKFALCFTLGSAMCLAAFMSLRGWRHQLKHMLSQDRLLFTLGDLLGPFHCSRSASRESLIWSLNVAHHSLYWRLWTPVLLVVRQGRSVILDPEIICQCS